MTKREANQILTALMTMHRCSLSGKIYVPYDSVRALINVFTDEEVGDDTSE